jgi:predicted secreted protein
MIIGLLSLVLLSSDPAPATPPAAPAAAQAPTPAPAAKPAKEKKICKADDADSGSHMVRRVCLTAEEWAQRGQGMINSSRSGISGTADTH